MLALGTGRTNRSRQTWNWRAGRAPEDGGTAAVRKRCFTSSFAQLVFQGFSKNACRQRERRFPPSPPPKFEQHPPPRKSAALVGGELARDAGEQPEGSAAVGAGGRRARWKSATPRGQVAPATGHAPAILTRAHRACQRRRGGGRWIRTTEGRSPIDLQSILVGHLSIPPTHKEAVESPDPPARFKANLGTAKPRQRAVRGKTSTRFARKIATPAEIRPEWIPRDAPIGAARQNRPRPPPFGSSRIAIPACPDGFSIRPRTPGAEVPHRCPARRRIVGNRFDRIPAR